MINKYCMKCFRFLFSNGCSLITHKCEDATKQEIISANRHFCATLKFVQKNFHECGEAWRMRERDMFEENKKLKDEIEKENNSHKLFIEEIESLRAINLKLNAELFNRVETKLPDSAFFIRGNGGWVPYINVKEVKPEEIKPKFKSGDRVVYIGPVWQVVENSHTPGEKLPPGSVLTVGNSAESKHGDFVYCYGSGFNIWLEKQCLKLEEASK